MVRLKRGARAEVTAVLSHRGGRRYAIVAGTRVLITARQIGGFVSNTNVGTLFTGVESVARFYGALKSLEDLQKESRA